MATSGTNNPLNQFQAKNAPTGLKTAAANLLAATALPNPFQSVRGAGEGNGLNASLTPPLQAALRKAGHSV